LKKIRMNTQIIGGTSLMEEYVIANNKDSELYAEELIESYNNTLRPGEKPRKLLSVIVIAENIERKTEDEYE